MPSYRDDRASPPPHVPSVVRRQDRPDRPEYDAPEHELPIQPRPADYERPEDDFERRDALRPSRTPSPFVGEADAGDGRRPLTSHAPVSRPVSRSPTRVLIRSPPPQSPSYVIRPSTGRPTTFPPPESVQPSGRRTPAHYEEEDYASPPPGQHVPDIRRLTPTPPPSGRVRTPYVAPSDVSIPPRAEPYDPYAARDTGGLVPSGGVPPGGFVPSEEAVPPGGGVPPGGVIPSAGVVPPSAGTMPMREEYARRPTSPRSVVPAFPPGVAPSGPGGLQLEDALHQHELRMDEHDQRLGELARLAEEAEERREQGFRDHEDERDRVFQENEQRRDREAMEHIQELENVVQPPVALRVPPSGSEVDLRGQSRPGTPSIIMQPEYDDAEVPTGLPSVSRTPSMVSRLPPVQAAPAPQLQEILDMLFQQQQEAAESKAAERAEQARLREEAAEDRARAQAECEARIAQLEAELARTREELEMERGQRRQDELERMERERAEVIERDEAMRQQLSDITSLVQGQTEECERKKQLMDERWAEKENRRTDKQARQDELFNLVQQIIQERAEEREVLAQERAAAVGRPGRFQNIALHFQQRKLIVVF